MATRFPGFLAPFVIALALAGCKGGGGSADGTDADKDGWTADVDCDDNDPNAWIGQEFYADEDGDGFGDADNTTNACYAPDGYVSNDEDCDDGDDAVHPDGTEVCNGEDDDCDGSVDDGVTDTNTYYADEDGDGFGDEGSTTEACVTPDGYADNASDCDDGDPFVNPEADERCNDRDDDCDGFVDDNPTDTPTWYTDADGDGFGDPSTGVTSCDQPTGTVVSGSDCDDTDPSVHPEAPEDCDGVDDDCDGNIDEGFGTTTWYADSDGDGFGDASATVDACAQPDGYVADDTDCDDAVATTHPGADELCNGEDDDCDGTLDEDAVDEPTFYADADGDTFGDPDVSVTACTEPTGYVLNDADCVDSDDTIHPGHDEICDGVDEDCDGTVDNDPIDGDLYATDADGDTFGEYGSTKMACSGVDNELDCDDADPSEPVVVDAATGSSSGVGTLASPLDTIQAGIDAATECVIVYPGTYTEAITFGGSDLVVSSVDGPGVTTIDASAASDAAVSFVNGETSDARLSGFTITGGTGRLETTSTSYACSSTTTCTDYYSVYCGGGVVIDGADPTLDNLILVDNVLPVAATSTSGNDTYYTYSYGGGVCAIASNSRMSRVSMFDNFADQGGGLYVDDTSAVEFSVAQVFANSGVDGAGFVVDGGALTLTNVSSAWNVASATGGGVLVLDGALTATNVTHGGDDAPDGAGVYASGSSTATVMNSIVYGAATGEGVLVDGTSTFTGSYNDVFGNGGGAYVGVTDPTGTNGNIATDPLFVAVSNDGDFTNDDWTLQSTSPAIDAGNPATTYEDADGSRNDMGAYGGPLGAW